VPGLNWDARPKESWIICVLPSFPPWPGITGLRIVQPGILEKAEKQLEEHPKLKKALEREAFQEAVLLPLSKAEGVRLEHLKIRDKPVRPREGILWEAKKPVPGQTVFLPRPV